MAGNLLPLSLHYTFEQKVSNFPDNLYDFNEGDNITTLMKILLGNGGTGQLNNLQLIARLAQQNIEFSNLDTILGLILQVKRQSSEIYSFATNPFIDQLTDTQWQEIVRKDAAYRERLLGAAEAFQTGATLWGILTLCEALTQMKFYIVESWRTPGYGRAGVDSQYEIVLMPLLDGTFWTFDQGKAYAILNVIQQMLPSQFIISFGTGTQTMTSVPMYNTTPTAPYSEYFQLIPTVNSNLISPPGFIEAGAATRYWVKNSQNNIAPFFAHLQTQEISIDLTGNITSVTSTDATGDAANSVALPALQITSTVYGAQ